MALSHGFLTKMQGRASQKAALKAELQRLVDGAYPLLQVVDDGDRLSLKGGLPIREEGKELALYQVEIVFPDSYPEEIPVVREIGGKIPKISDRHVDSDGSACLFVRDETYKFCPPGYTVAQFIEGPVRQFFLGQVVFDDTGKFPAERKHGVDGILDFYEEVLGTRNMQTVITFLEYLTHAELKGHRECFCGSKKKIRNCHLTVMQDFKNKIRQVDAERSLKQLKLDFGRSSGRKHYQ